MAKAVTNTTTISSKDPAVLALEAEARKKRKIIERSLMLLALIGTIAVMSLYRDLWIRLLPFYSNKEDVYGVWVERGVAFYAADSFELSSKGVSVNGRVISSDFKFNGHTLEYKTANVTHTFKMMDDANTTMMNVSSSHYRPIFVLSAAHHKS